MTQSTRALVVFDLDACCWSPEMYELWGGGAPFSVVRDTPGGMTLADARGVQVKTTLWARRRGRPARWRGSHRPL